MRSKNGKSSQEAEDFIYLYEHRSMKKKGGEKKMRLKIRCYENECEQIARVKYSSEDARPTIYCCIRHATALIQPTELTQFGWIKSLEHKGWREIREGYQSQEYTRCYDCLCEMERKPVGARVPNNSLARSWEKGSDWSEEYCWVCECEHKARLAAWKDSLNINVSVGENRALYDEVALNSVSGALFWGYDPAWAKW